jgi:GNAT superfamily N-acetyltransferase
MESQAPCIIRPARVADGAALGAVHVRGWQWAYRGLMPDAFLDSLDRRSRGRGWAAMVAEDRSKRTIVAEVDGRVIGLCSYGPSRDADATPDTGEIHCLYLEQEWVGRGVGRALWEHALDALRDGGFRECTAWALVGNERGRRFFESMGLTDDGGRKQDETRNFLVQEVRYAVALAVDTETDVPHEVTGAAQPSLVG